MASEHATNSTPLALDPLQRDVLLPQIETILDVSRDATAHSVYSRLKECIEQLNVPAELHESLGAIVELALASGRVRRLFGPPAELSLSALFQKTPRGRQMARSVSGLNAALAELKGQAVEEIAASFRAPGSYVLMLRTNQCTIAIRFEQSGVVIESLEVNLA